MSPQHWAAETEKLTGKTEKETTYSDRTVLKWEDMSKTIMLDKSTNVGNINTAEGCKAYGCTLKNHNNEEDNTKVKDTPIGQLVSYSTEVSNDFRWTNDNDEEGDIKRYTEMENDHRNASKYLLYHQFGHVSPDNIKAMARNKIIKISLPPDKLLPKCTECMYGKSMKRKRQSKTTKQQSDKNGINTGDKVSIDQMESPTAGLVAQMIGKPTKIRYNVVTIFVDQATGYTQSYPQVSTG